MPVIPRCKNSVILALLISVPLCASAWDEGGHEIVATVAKSRLNPKALAAVNRLARAVPTDRGPYDAVTMACWMDDLRARDPAMPDDRLFLSWHYIDIGLTADDPMPSMEPGNDNELRGDSVQAFKRAMVVLQGGTDPYVKSQAIACALIMHLVGDIHQPLHAATKYFYSRGRLEQDRGGNREGVDNGPLDEPRFNLHAFWDSAWRASMDGQGRVVLDESFRPGPVHHPERVVALAAEMEREVPPAGLNLSPQIDAWAWESNQIARNFVYPDLTPTESLILPIEQQLCCEGESHRPGTAGARGLQAGGPAEQHARLGSSRTAAPILPSGSAERIRPLGLVGPF